MNVRTFRRLFGYTAAVPSLTLRTGQDVRDLGRYSIPEAAAFIAVPSRTMRRWFLGEQRFFRPSYHRGSDVLLSFNDVTEAFIVESLRHHWEFGPHAIRAILHELRKKTKLDRPLVQRPLAVIPEFKQVVAMVPSKGKTIYPDLAHHQNLVFDDFVHSMGMRIRRDRKGMPVRIFPWKDSNSEDQPVSIDPDVMSGELVVTGTRIPAARVLANYYAGKSAEQIADSYDLDRNLIRKVILHFERAKP
jgi:uncharacterized protein (DUF433 family)